MTDTLISEVPGASCSTLHFGAASADGLSVCSYLSTAGIYGINISFSSALGIDCGVR